MREIKDCIFIGHNETQFQSYEMMLRSMGTHTTSYRDLELNFVYNNDEPLTFSDMFNRYYYTENSSEKLSMGNTFSTTIAYLGTFLSRRGFTYDYINSFQDDKEKLESLLSTNDYRAILIPTTLYVSPMPLMEVISLVREYNETAKIIVGGPFIATQTKLAEDDETLQFLFESIGADFYINSSQGELALSKIMTAINYGKSYDNIDNIFYRDGDRFIKNRVSAENNSLSDNMVQWDLFEKDINKFLAIRTSISCPFRCKFCGFPQHAGKYQCIDIDHVEQELNAIEKMGKVTSLNFIDDTLNIPEDRYKDMLKMMIKNKYSFKWNSHYRCQFADEETVALMKESGCEGVFLGIESGDTQILNNMNKASTVERYKEGIRLLKKYGILIYASFIIGFPGETDETVQNTIDFINETQPDYFRTQLWYCDPITPIWNEKDTYKIEGSQFQWSHMNMDAEYACDWIKKIFLNLHSSIWVPQYNFEFDGVFSLTEKGFSNEEVKRMLDIFNQGIRERLNGTSKEMRSELVYEFKKICNQHSTVKC